MDQPKKFHKPPANLVYNIDDAVCGTDEAVVEAIQTSIRAKLQQGTLVIPRLPLAAGRILQLTQGGEDVDLGEATRVIMTDAALAAHILNSANSAAFSGNGRVAGIQSAVMRLGIKTVCNIVFTESLQTKLFSARSYREIVEQSWHLSLGTAVACDVLSRSTGIEREAAFLLGLLHETGTPTLIGAVSEYEHRNNGRPLGQEIVEILHSQLHEEIGAHVLEQWAMPAPLIEAAGGHHRYRGSVNASPAHRLIYAANLICQKLGVGAEQRDIMFNVEHVFSDLGLTDSGPIEELLATVTAEIASLTSGFGSSAPRRAA